MSSAAFAACGKHSGEGERCSGRYRKVFGFVTGMAFTFAPESRSPSSRNAVRLPTGIAFGIDRIYQLATCHNCGCDLAAVAASTHEPSVQLATALVHQNYLARQLDTGKHPSLNDSRRQSRSVLV
jgi:hypothetical protein